MLKPSSFLKPLLTPRTLVIVFSWASYLLAFALLHDRIGMSAGALAIFPVVTTAWHLGILGGVMATLLAMLADMAILSLWRGSPAEIIDSPGSVIGSLALLAVAVIIGQLMGLTRRHRVALRELQQMGAQRQSDLDFFTLLNEITVLAVSGKGVEAVLRQLPAQLARLFRAEDCLILLRDEAGRAAMPLAAEGPLQNTFLAMRCRDDETSLPNRVLEQGAPLTILDVPHSAERERNPELAAFPAGYSMLALPLASEEFKFGVLILGYAEKREFEHEEVARGKLAAQQISLALARIRLLEDAQRRADELAVLNEIALASTRVESEHELLERATEIIGRKLFPDNFGVLLLDEVSSQLRPHTSYRFYVPALSAEAPGLAIPLGQGVCGQVAQSGRPQRIGEVRPGEHYPHMDSRTRSELCVPIQVKGRTLGVINAESVRANAFSAADEQLLVTLAGQLGTAIEALRARKMELDWLAQLAHSNALISALSHVSTAIDRALNIADLLRTLGDEFRKLEMNCVVALYMPERDQLTVRHASLDPREAEQLHSRSILPLDNYTFPAARLQGLHVENRLKPALSRHPFTLLAGWDGGKSSMDAEGQPPMEAGLEKEALYLPLLFEERYLGALWLWGKDTNRKDLPVFSIFARQVGIALENARLFEEVQNLALTDPLTGLYNRRGLFELGRIEFARAERLGRSFSGILLDLDHFKQVNDTYGHPVGDQVLQEFARRCKGCVREIDLVGRYGGEEIVVLLPETEVAIAVQVAERLRAAMAASPISVGEHELRITLSAGVAGKDENTPTLDTLIARADQAMYMAKHKGRNRVAVSS